MKNLRLEKIPPSGVDIYNFLKVIWEEEQISAFRDFGIWYNNKDVVPTFEAMQKTMGICHNKGIDISKVGCTLPNLDNTSPHMSTNNRSKTKMKTKLASVQDTINSRVNTMFKKLNKRKSRTTAFELEDECIEEEEEADMITQFLQMKTNQFLDLQQHFERYINSLPVFGFNNGKYDLISSSPTSYLISFMMGIFNLQLSKRPIILFP